MSPEQFIVNHVEKILIDEGIKGSLLSTAKAAALKFYRNTAKFKKGKAFDESLNAARVAIGGKLNKKAVA